MEKMTEKYTHLNTKEGDYHVCTECYYNNTPGEPCISCHIRNGLAYPMRFKLDKIKELKKENLELKMKPENNIKDLEQNNRILMLMCEDLTKERKVLKEKNERLTSLSRELLTILKRSNIEHLNLLKNLEKIIGKPIE